MSWSTKFATARLNSMFDEMEEALTDRAQGRYQKAADDAADWWGGRIASSGRASGHGMENVQGRVTQPRSGGFFVRMGWLGSAPRAADGKTTWFVYQDTGYDPFGMVRKGFNARMVPGLMLQVDARQLLAENLRDANRLIARDVRNAARRRR